MVILSGDNFPVMLSQYTSSEAWAHIFIILINLAVSRTPDVLPEVTIALILVCLFILINLATSWTTDLLPLVVVTIFLILECLFILANLEASWTQDFLQLVTIALILECLFFLKKLEEFWTTDFLCRYGNGNMWWPETFTLTSERTWNNGVRGQCELHKGWL